ncbi:hypothetical protein [Trichodesmium erythraeum]|uniref:hypothetical protein n=1 Tax=Trichodesmium erythraeum TaxID=1206 RepID=UPI00003C9DE7
MSTDNRVARERMTPASQMGSLDILKKVDSQLTGSVHQRHKNIPRCDSYKCLGRITNLVVLYSNGQVKIVSL